MLSLEQWLTLALIVAIPCIAGWLISRNGDTPATTTMIVRRHTRRRRPRGEIPDGDE